MRYQKVMLLLMICLLFACTAKSQTSFPTANTLESTEGMITSADLAQLSESELPKQQFELDFWPKDLYGTDVVGTNSKQEVEWIEMGSGEKSVLSSNGRNVVLSEVYIAWTTEEGQVTGQDDEGSYEMESAHIFVYHRATGEQKRITAEPAPRTQLAISGTRLVWADKRHDMDADYYDYDIYAYDLATDTEYAIAIAPGSQQQPSISGDLIVWQDNRNSPQRSTGLSGCNNCADNRFDLYLYDFKDGTSQPIVEGEGLKSSPVIDGNRVAWTWFRDSMNADLYLLTLDSGQIQRITQTAESETSPILSAERLLWSVRQPCDVMEIGADGQEIPSETGIYLLELKTTHLQKLTSYIEPFAVMDQKTVAIREACWGGFDVYAVRLE